MADRDRSKKDGQNKDKKNERMRQGIAARHAEEVTERQRQKHEAKMTDTEPRGEAKRRQSSK